MLTHKQNAAVIVIDVDRRGTYGGTIESLHTDVRTKLGVLAAGNLGPSWIGVNPLNGKCQLTGKKTPEPDQEPKQQFTSCRDLINAVRSRREEAEATRKPFSSLEKDLPDAEALDGNRIDGVKVLWISDECAARDETAFRHALSVAHRLREAGERMTDAKIIDV